MRKISSEKYTIYKNTISFSVNFCECLTSYYNILMSVTHVVFEECHMSRSQFNNYFPALKNIISIIFGSSFNKPFIPGKYMECLSLGGCFNKFIELSKRIKNLSFRALRGIFVLNQLVTLSKNIVDLRIEPTFNFNQPLNLTKKIKTFKLLCESYNNPIILSKYLYRLILNCKCPPFILNKTIKILELYNCDVLTCVLDSTTNIRICYSPINYFIRDSLPNTVNAVCEYSNVLVRFPIPFKNIPNHLVETITNENGHRFIQLTIK